MEKYNKPPLTYAQQVDLLAGRGLIVSNRDKAEEFLSQVNYYRFSAYCLPFESSRHRFKSNVKFDDIHKLYEFDRQLRFLIDEALEIIEISVRTAITYGLTHKYGPFVHEDSVKFYSGFDHKEWIEKVHQEIERSKETFIKHYHGKYEGFPKLPFWMAVEVMSFGILSQLYHNLCREDQINIAKAIGLHSKVLSSWLHTFTYIRNICAHHSRIWNRELAIALAVPKGGKWEYVNTKRVASVVFAINYFLSKLSLDPFIPKNWHREMDSLLNKSVNVEQFYKSMGFPDDFQNHELWKI